jgi:hypothetical protein
VQETKTLENAGRVTKRETAWEIIEDFAKENGFTFQILQPWQIRISEPNSNLKYDIYTTSQRWHNLTNNTRGYYKSLQDFLEHLCVK